MDWNNDGRKDLLVGEANGKVRIYLNTGTDAAPAFSGFSYLQMGGNDFSTGCNAAPRVVDWNKDGRKDVLCGELSGRVYLLLNSGTDASPVFSSSSFIKNGAVVLSVGADSVPMAVDWNQDGKKDLLVGCEAGTIYLLINKGTDAAPSFNGWELVKAGGAELDVGYNSHPMVCDWDGDGAWDIIGGAYEYPEESHVWCFGGPIGPFLSAATGLPSSGLEPGSTVDISCVVMNAGAAVKDVVAVLSSTVDTCRVELGRWEIGDMEAGAARTNAAQPFRLRVDESVPLGLRVPLELVLSGGSGTYLRTNVLQAVTAKPEFVLVDFLVNDSQGNSNCALEPGETGELLVRLRNAGYPAENVRGRLLYSHGIELQKEHAEFGDVGRNRLGINSQHPFVVTGLPYVPELPFYALEVTCDRATFTNTIYLETVTTYPRDRQAVSQWVDMTGATRLTLANDGYEMVSLPDSFYVKLYRYWFSSVYVFADGYLSMYSEGTPLNTALPHAAPPYGLIAPYWDDLDPSAGGQVRYRFVGTSPSRFLAVEWNNVPRRGDTATRMTFQVLLFESGDVKFQYGNSTGANADGRSATIGLGDYYGENAAQHAFNQAGSVTNGMALYYRYAAGSDDTDADSLPDLFERLFFGGIHRTGADDFDRDGTSDLAEFRAGTDPALGESCLHCEPPEMEAAGEYTFSWCSVAGRSYRVWWKSKLEDPEWQLLTPIPVLGDSTGVNRQTFRIDAAGGTVFMRVSTP